ncbi:MAG TPA: hypothetical protein VLV78_10620 [Thermoanaerobaculia bacterium]|nr:hypothetical protein [Thermoanaerobaculia bacterium]
MVRRITAHLDDILELPPPPLVAVRGCDPYSATYSYSLSHVRKSLAELAVRMAEELMALSVRRRLMFFTGMLLPPVSSSVFHRCMSLLRSGIVRITGDPRAALHAPVKTEAIDSGFPLHADLFLTERLWLIFDDVPSGSSGKALFLSREAFDRIAAACADLPASARRRIGELLDHRAGRDSFDEFYGLLYEPRNPWTRSLARDMRRESWSIKLRSGEGYLLHDGHWLHGRTAVRGGVSGKRFRRLIYGRPVTA